MLIDPRLTVKGEKAASPAKAQKKPRFRAVKLEERVVPASVLSLLGKTSG